MIDNMDSYINLSCFGLGVVVGGVIDGLSYLNKHTSKSNPFIYKLAINIPLISSDAINMVTHNYDAINLELTKQTTSFGMGLFFEEGLKHGLNHIYQHMKK